MSRKKQTAADYIERHDDVMRLILGEMVGYARQIDGWWASAHDVVREDPDAAIRLLIDAEIHLNTHVRIDLADSLRYIRAAIDRLDAELPDDPDESPT